MRRTAYSLCPAGNVMLFILLQLRTPPAIALYSHTVRHIRMKSAISLKSLRAQGEHWMQFPLSPFLHRIFTFTFETCQKKLTSEILQPEPTYEKCLTNLHSSQSQRKATPDALNDSCLTKSNDEVKTSSTQWTPPTDDDDGDDYGSRDERAPAVCKSELEVEKQKLALNFPFTERRSFGKNNYTQRAIVVWVRVHNNAFWHVRASLSIRYGLIQAGVFKLCSVRRRHTGMCVRLGEQNLCYAHRVQ